MLFEIWIVDASIFVVCCVHCHVWFIFCMTSSSAWTFWASLWLPFCLLGGWVGVMVGSFLLCGWWCVGVGGVGGVCDKL